VFHYEILIDAQVRISWAGKGRFREPAARAEDEAMVLLPLSTEGAQLIGDLLGAHYRPEDSVAEGADRIRLRATVTDIAKLKTAKIVFETQLVRYT
jgi:hypothetical protein